MAQRRVTATDPIGRFRARKKPTVGFPVRRSYSYGSVRRRLSIDFTAEMFNKIAKQAKAYGVSFSEQVRTYCEWGLEEEKNARED